jgi:hypothetical protein
MYERTNQNGVDYHFDTGEHYGKLGDQVAPHEFRVSLANKDYYGLDGLQIGDALYIKDIKVYTDTAVSTLTNAKGEVGAEIGNGPAFRLDSLSPIARYEMFGSKCGEEIPALFNGSTIHGSFTWYDLENGPSFDYVDDFDNVPGMEGGQNKVLSAGSKSFIYFNGGGDILESTLGTTLRALSEGSITFVLQLKDLDTQNFFHFTDVTGGGNYRIELAIGSTSLNTRIQDDVLVVTYQGGPSGIKTKVDLGSTTVSPSWTEWWDMQGAALDTLAIGGANAAGTYSQYGKIGMKFMMFTPTYMTETQLTDLHTYLMNRYNIPIT